MNPLENIRSNRQEEPIGLGTKKRYASPTLLDYGNVSKLTEGPGGSRPDGMSGMNRAPMGMNR